MCTPLSNRTRLCLGVVVFVSIAGCEATSHRVGQNASVQFGVVQSAEEVRLDSNAAQGAIIGGTIGVLAGGRGSRGRGAATGAVLGGAATAAAQGNRSGTQYTVRMSDGSATRIVSDQSEIKVNDCVAVERVGNSANIRRVSTDYCDPANTEAVTQVSAATREDAAHCEAAKQELAAAEDEKAVDLASRKVELLCDE